VTADGPQFITSAGNQWLKDLRRLAQDSTAYRKQHQVWLEGDHLCRAALARGVAPASAVFSQSLWDEASHQWPIVRQAEGRLRTVVMPDALFASISALESPGRMGFVLDLPPPPPLEANAASVILDRLQDAGNVGAILRCAAAFGFRQVLALKGTAGLWSPKVMRAGMGAHFGLHLIEALDAGALDQLAVPIIATSSHAGEWLHRASLPWPCAWALGHEGQGLGDELASRASVAVRIVQPGGEESLNVAAAATIRLHASAAAQAR
jgi:RNA methyltransferase, TrmH family